MPPIPARACTALLLMMSLAPVCARAAELVTLRNGFSVTCDRRETRSGKTVRLYLRSPSGAGNYMDVAADQVAAVENVTEPSQPAPAAAQSAAQPTSSILADSGARHNVNIALLASVVQAESGGNAKAVSRTGARGLMQLMPGTAAQLAVKDSFDPARNVNGGSAYLDQLLTRYHDNLALALAAYNAGPAAVDRYHGIPPFRETRAYVATVIREFNRRVAEQARTASATVVR